MTEEQLLQGIGRGDDAAKRDLYCRYAPQAMAVAMRYVADADAARDVLHDSFVKILTSVGRFTYRGEGSLRAWVMRIVANEALDALRRRSRLTFTADVPDDVADEEEPDVGLPPPAVLHRLIAQLPPGYRAVLNLFALEQLSHREIGRRLGISEHTSASQYFRAKRLLAKMINEYQKRPST